MARGLKFGFRKQRDCTIYVAKTKALRLPNDRRADKNPYRHDRHADKNPYWHDCRADSQCLHKNLKLLFFPIGGKRCYFSQLNRYGNCSQKSEKIDEY